MPGRIARWRSARLAIAVRRGSITTTFAPRATACCTSGGKCVFDTVGLAPQMTTSCAFTTSSGSADAMSPYTWSHAAPTVWAQMVCSTIVAPSAANSASLMLLRSTAPADEL